MKSFWKSLLIFILLMCSCKTQKLDSNVRVRDDAQSEASYLNESVKIDSTKTTYTEQISETKVIKETIIEEVYDKDSGTLTKKTTTKREVTQDSDTVVAEEETQSVTDCNGLAVDHFADVSTKVDSDAKEESVGGQESFGKWLGIVLGCLASILIVYLLRKFRVN